MRINTLYARYFETHLATYRLSEESSQGQCVTLTELFLMESKECINIEQVPISFQLTGSSSGDFYIHQHFLLQLKQFANLTPEMRVMTGETKGDILKG